MKIPLRWLSEYVSLPESTSYLVERMTLAGLEVGGVKLFGLPVPEGLRVKEDERGPVWEKDKYVIAQIKEIKQHPDADKLKLPMVDYGTGEVKQLVTGAPNIQVGESSQKVVLALQGAEFIDTHGKAPEIKRLKPTKLRGIPSDAMVCSYAELGVSDDAEGIILLEDDAPVGMPLVDFMGESVVEVDVLPNMARCLSMIGVAREVAAITGQKIKLPPHQMQTAGDAIAGQVKVEIEDSKLSARYAAILLKNVEIKSAPGWMQRRLMYAGMRPISNIVDITNFVMLEWGQPLHAFDYDVLVKRAGGKAPTIIVRPAREGEMLKTLDDVERKLTPDNLVIADTAGPIAIAGVMGGAETEVTAGTKNILLESANFNNVSIRRTMRQFDLPSEASVRFSRGVHPELVRPTAERAAELMRQYGNATICAGIVDNYPAPLQPQVITLRASEIKRLLGIDFPVDEAARILQSLEFTVEKQDADTLRVTTPPHRLDIQEGEADLIEDLARIAGYDKLPATLLADQLPAQHTNEPLVFEDRVRDILASVGLQEAITYSLTTPEREAPLGIAGNTHVQLVNPISSDRGVMRQSLLTNLLEVLATNLRTIDDVRLFEIGSVYLPREEANLPDEPRRLAVVMTGKRGVEYWQDSATGATKPVPLDFFDLKGIVESLVADLHLTDVKYQPSQATYLHPARAAELLTGHKSVGHFGQMHPRVAIQCGFDTQRTILVGEFDLEAMRAAAPDRYKYTPVPRFPAALRDIAILVDESVPAEKLEAEIRAGGGDLLSSVWLFDVFKGGNLAPGKKSLAYALSYQADDRTLVDKEVDKAHKKIEERLKRTLNAEIRGRE
jgi:phenylalanyl-tRNA synthetase beta chain